MKTIIITSFHVFTSRNILSAPFLRLLCEDGWRVVIVAPEKKQAFLEREFGNAQVSVRGINNRLTRWDAFFKTLALAALRTRSLEIMKKRGMGIEHPFLVKCLFWAPLVRPFIPLLYRLCMPRNTFSDLFEVEKPDLVFSPDVFSANDCRIMHEAKAREIPVLGMVRSWDNLTTKGGFRVVPDILVANNEIVRDEALKLHHIPRERIRIVGIPHYDTYRGFPRLPREKILHQLGVPSGKRYIVYAPLGDRIVKVGERMIPHTLDRDYIALMLKFLPPEYVLFVRLPPTDTVTLGDIAKDPRLIIDRPGERFGEGLKAIRMTELSPADDRHLVETIAESDALFTVSSSIAVDALYLEKPVVLIGFDPKPATYWESVLRIHEFEHIQSLLSSRAVFVARMKEDLKHFLASLLSLSVPDDAREELLRRECFRSDGKSSERLIEVVAEAYSS